MKTLPHIVLAEPIIHGVLKVAFDDGFEGVVDLRPLLAKGKVFAWLKRPLISAELRIDEYGHSAVVDRWIRHTSSILSADSLRRDAERQAEAHRLMVG